VRPPGEGDQKTLTTALPSKKRKCKSRNKKRLGFNHCDLFIKKLIQKCFCRTIKKRGGAGRKSCSPEGAETQDDGTSRANASRRWGEKRTQTIFSERRQKVTVKSDRIAQKTGPTMGQTTRRGGKGGKIEM